MAINNASVRTSEVSKERVSELFVQTQGAMVLTGAGFGWLMSGLSAAGDIPLFLLLAVLGAAALLLGGGWAARRLAPGIAEPPWTPRVGRGFWLAFGAETAAISLIVAVALLLHCPHWIPPFVALAVGLHFFPLATLFQRPLYYVTGAALCLVCLGTIFFMPPQWGMRHMQGWQLSAGLGAGVVLWLSALAMLIQSAQGLRKFKRTLLLMQ